MIRPMLAAKCDNTALLPYPLIASPKLDGIRAILHQGRVKSRTMKDIPNDFVQASISHFDLDGVSMEGLDGELIVGSMTDKNVFQATTSGVMSKHGKPNFRFLAFDIVKPLTYDQRFLAISSGFRFPFPIQVLEWRIVKSEAQLLEYEAECLARGFEGVCLRRPGSAYKFGRSTLREGHLIKLKRFLDAEATIIGFQELMHNENDLQDDNFGLAKRSSHGANLRPGGILGAFTVRASGFALPFEVGTGFTQAQREDFWKARAELIGRQIKFKYLPHGVKDKPRHPVFLGFRHPIDSE